MPKTYEPIATTTLGSNQANVTFSGITGTYTDLVLIANHVGFTTTGAAAVYCRLNSDTGTNYSATYLIGNGTAASSGRSSSDNRMIIGAANNGTGTGEATAIVNFMNYANSTTYKTVISRYSQAGRQVESDVGLLRSTSAITAIEYGTYSTNSMLSGSTFTLYGIKAA
jgi:hypothetical protein